MTQRERIPAPPVDVLNTLEPATDDQLRRNTGLELAAWCSDDDKARFAAIHSTACPTAADADLATIKRATTI